MYYGLPIISTDCISIKNIVEKEKVGIVYESENIRAFANSILRLYNAKDEASLYSKNAKKVVSEKYNWDLAVKEMINMYNNLN